VSVDNSSFGSLGVIQGGNTLERIRVEERKLLETWRNRTRLLFATAGTVADLAKHRNGKVSLKVTAVQTAGANRSDRVKVVRGNNQSGQATKGVWGMSWCQEA